jgi:ATP-dependent helicase HrpB
LNPYPLPLPIDGVLDSLKQLLQLHHNVILIAQPGAGKTTRVPLALLDEPWLAAKKIILLEPRRLSARAAARYMAAILDERVGETIGFRMRHETIVGPKTRVEVVTEGVLTRMLLADPSLSGIGLVIFDEFHERSLHADTGIALCLQAQTLLESDVRLLLMSATMDADSLSEKLQAPVLKSEGRVYPVQTCYLDKPVLGRIEDTVVRVIKQALLKDEGDVLVFLPGVGEIRRVDYLLRQGSEAAYSIVSLYGDLPADKQDLALRPDPEGRRRIVLSTPVAETGLTVEGIRVVIDSGLMRTPKFSPKTGMSRLETVLISAASADQRRGRAGRTSPGVCYRLWTIEEHGRLASELQPEIADADLASLALLLAEWGAQPDDLMWITPPPASHYSQAKSILMQLDALTESGLITSHGRAMMKLGTHPRIAHMMLQGHAIALGYLACAIAALLGEKDFFTGDSSLQADLRLRVDWMIRMDEYETNSASVDAVLLQRAKESAGRFRQLLSIPNSNNADTNAVGLVLSYAYPDRIAMKRADNKFLLSNGRGAQLRPNQYLTKEPYLVAADLDDSGADSRIWLAAPVELEQLVEHQRSIIHESVDIRWDESTHAVKSTKVTRLGALKLKERQVLQADHTLIKSAFIEGIRRVGLRALPWNKSNTQLRERMLTLQTIDPSWPDVSDEGLMQDLQEWLFPFIDGFKHINDLSRLPLHDALRSLLSWEQIARIDQLAPTHFTVPSGSRIPIQYGDPTSPFLAVRLQEMFGLTTTPSIADNQIPLTIQLLSPAGRPVQITRDLTSFWRDTYYEVKKDLKGRYPKHYWPEDPSIAMPTNRVRPK